MKNKDKIKLGLIGCGAIAERHLQVLQKKDVQLVVAVDANEATAKHIKEKYRFESFTTDYREIYNQVNAVINCLPNFLHAPVSIDFLKQGINVLCEKPMALNANEAKMMISAAKDKSTILSAANVRRFYWSSKEIKKIISEKSMGEVLEIDAEEGFIFSWKSKSGFFFDKNKAGGGVLLDMGSHLLDLILWFVADYPVSISYKDDNYGGVEADAELEMFFNRDLKVFVKISRLRNLRNINRIKFTKGEIFFRPDECNKILIVNNDGISTFVEAPIRKGEIKYFEDMMDDFLESVSGGKPLFIDPNNVLPSIKLIDLCYSNQKRFEPSWL
jgi:predicted dehydrogenase